MKKLFLFLLVGFFAVVVAACSNLPTLESISISGQDVEFYVGEEFNTGELKVVAKLSDDSTEDVTAQVVVSHNANMNAVGTYPVTVEYKGLTQTYTIAVVKDELVSVAVQGLKTEYCIGEKVSLAGATVKETYDSGKVVDGDLSTYDVVLVADGVEYTGAFAKLGTNTVKLTKSGVSYQYDVTVSANLYDSVEDAVAKGVANANKVASGSAVVDNSGYVNENSYAFGQDYTYVSSADGEYHYTVLEDGSVFGLVSGTDWDGNPYLSSAYEPTVSNLLGVDFRAVVNYEYDVYGVEALVDTLVYMAQSESAENYVEVLPTEVAKENTYAFSFATILSGYYYYLIEVSFVLDGEAEVFTKVNVSMKGYYLVYNEETGENDKPVELGEPDFTRVVTVEQVVGAQDAENPYPLEELFVESFEVQDAEENVLADGATLTVPMKGQISLFIVNVLPETANTSVDELNVTVLDESGFETWSVYGSYWDGVVSVSAHKVGNYTLVISTTNVTYTFNLVVAYSELTELNAAVYNASYYELVAASEATVFVGQVLQFGAIVNDGANPAVVATCEGATIVSDYEYLEFTAEAVGEYVITLVSVENEAIKATLTVTVKEAPSVAELLNGTYQFVSMMVGTATYEFTPESEGATKGQLVITYEGPYVGKGKGYFNYEYVDGYLYTTPQNVGSYNCIFGVTLGAQFDLQCTYNGWEQGALTKVENVENALSGTYNSTFTHPMNGMAFAMALTFNADGTGSYSLMNGAYEGSFAYELNEGTILFSDVVAVFGADVTFYAVVDGNVITCTTAFSDAGNELELEYVGGNADVEEEATTTPVVGENKVNASYWGSVVTFTAEEAGTYTLSVDGNVAILAVEIGYVTSYEPTVTVTLEAGAMLSFAVLLNESGADQVVTLTIAKN